MHECLFLNFKPANLLCLLANTDGNLTWLDNSVKFEHSVCSIHCNELAVKHMPVSVDRCTVRFAESFLEMDDFVWQ